jgi:predicted ATPase/DNA-binding CsgD family transcriptional regulator
MQTVPAGDGTEWSVPRPLTPLIGRNEELAAVRVLVASERLVTLVGTGGCGKTRLALATVEDQSERFPDGIAFVDLSAVASGGRVLDVLRDALAMPEAAGDDVWRVFRSRIADRHMLLILDNCEHVIDEVAEVVGTLLGACRNLSVLATSREPLAVDGEATWRVPSLALPPSDSSDVGVICDSDAVQLFVDRARRARDDFDLDENNASVIAELVRRIDGMALAIELAAARVNALDVRQILDGLDADLSLLAGTARARPARQRTMTASIDWSCALLDDDELTVFRRCSVFAGGFTLEMAAAVVDIPDCLDVVHRLVAKSLLVATSPHDGERRYSMLMPIQQYATQLLEEHGESDGVRDAQLHLIADLAEDAARHLTGRNQEQWLERLELEHANISLAFAWAGQRGEHARALAMASDLTFFWKLHGHFAEGAEILRGELAATDLDSEERARALWCLSDVCYWQGEVRDAQRLANEAMAVAERIGNDQVRALAFWTLGNAEIWFDFTKSRDYGLASVALADTGTNFWLQGVARQLVAITWIVADQFEQVEPWLTEEYEIAVEHGVPQLEAWHWWPTMCRAIREGRFRDADDAYERGMRACRPLQDPATYIAFVTEQAELLRRRGDIEESVRLVEECRADVEFRAAGAMRGWLDIAAARNAIGVDAERAAIAISDLRARTERTGVPSWAAWAELLQNRADVAAGEWGAVRARGRWTLEGLRATDWRSELSEQLRFAGFAELEDDPRRAAQHFHNALQVAVGNNFAPLVADALDALGANVAALHQDDHAARLFGAAAAARAAIGSVRGATDGAVVTNAVADVRARLGESEFETFSREGASMTMDEAVGYAQRMRGARGRPPAGWASLTPAELRVVELAAEGLSNRDIAGRLFVGDGTVKSHLAHAYTKLGVRNRAALAGVVAAQRNRA